ncbi:3-dehydro-bile acid delta(4,6)-reductase [Alphaproteobacteria bacterium SO-S41]|nr:3-dehydro-bile acid delta(4,6)-reductase [Alphaproteobacteria bacterium SO-S41]
MAAEVLSAAGLAVTVYERMPSVARKLLIAGRGGLNLTHSEPFEDFIKRYGPEAAWLRPMLEAYPPAALVAWAEGLGEAMFTGTSGRVFPKAMKASPLLRAWLARLAAQGVTIRTRTEWLGWEAGGALRFQGVAGEETVRPDVTVLALGGASWPKLGSDGAWVPVLEGTGVAVMPLTPANMGITIAWSETFRERFAGEPLKNVTASVSSGIGPHVAAIRARGEAVVTAYGLEGGIIYVLSRMLGRTLERGGAPVMTIDLRPELVVGTLTDRITLAAPGQSTTNMLRKAAKLSPLAVNLMREGIGRELPREPAALAKAIKNVPLQVAGVQGLDRAISSAGGVTRGAVDEALMLKARPGVFVAGEMLDWAAPTGGYLLQASFATGVTAAKGALAYVQAASQR